MNSEKPPQLENSLGNSKNESARAEFSRVQESAPGYEIFKNWEERYFLLHVADNFIDQIRNQENPYDALVYFDRGARLFGHLIRERWKHRFPEDKIPDTFFVKIGREMGRPSPDPDQLVYYEYPWENIFERDLVDEKLPSVDEIIDRVKDNIHFKKLVKSLRKSFSHNDKTIFDHKRVLLVDEFVASGATLAYGKELFSRAFDGAKVDGAGLVTRFEDYSVTRFKNYPGNSRVIKAVPGYSIPTSLGDPNYAGVKLPSPPSKEYHDQFFINPKHLNPPQEAYRRN